MAKKQVIQQGIKARQELAKGAQFFAECLGRTLGPFGENWFLEKGDRITNDGYKIAAELHITPTTLMPDGTYGNEINNRGLKAAREATVKTNDEAGEGTTGAAVLMWEIYDTTSKRLLPKEGVVGKLAPVEVVQRIEKEKNEVISKIQAMATPIETEEQLIESAIVSTEDKAMGELIGKAQWKLGKEGFLLAEETAEKESSIEYVPGVRFDNGFATSQVINNIEKQTLEVHDTHVLLTSFSIKTSADWNHIVKIGQSVFKAGGKQLVVIARAWTDETVHYCQNNINEVNKAGGNGLVVWPVNAPYMDMQEKFKDIQAVVGGTFYDSEGFDLEDLQLSDIGYASRIEVSRFNTIVVGVENDQTKERTAKRAEELNQKSEGSQSAFEKKNLAERIAQLQNGFGIVKVGSTSDMERKRLFDKAEDAVHAVRAAFQEGTVPGAGLTYKKISEELDNDYILKRPLLAIHEQIMSTAPSDFVIEDWVRDPVKVLRIQLSNACTAAASFATAGGAIAQAEPRPLEELFKQG